MLAPGYAAAIAFGAVALSSVVVSAATSQSSATGRTVFVIAEATDGDDPPPSGGTVTIRYTQSKPDSGALDENGRFAPSGLPLKTEVCLDPPAGWRFAGTETRDRQCQPVTDPAADVVFRLERS